MSFLQVNAISHVYLTKTEAKEAISNLSFSIEEGEFVSLIGPSGCGKSTLLSIISGLLTPTEGKVIVEGKNSNQPGKSMGYMLQQDYLFPWKTIKENCLLGLKLTNRLTKDTIERTLKLLDQMGLYDVRHAYPDQLSGGMRQRVALVRTLATGPDLLLLDEPFSALDYQTKLKLEDLVFSTLKEHNKSALLVTHDIGEAIAMSDRVILLSPRPGKIARTFHIPAHLRELLPFDARNDPKFAEHFQVIWKELDSLEQSPT
ncbi:ABC transporter ATP-binding protein [Pseudalkalibacillus hwajinpoensis]|uniref:ABC transporter ATP-binding protein n=1 Tax=Guptibacillus hwajinpoensis TaxID=208199 RepID=A0A4U1MFL2_9BACL|nr:ABC transporter ATP-binding protein [Pseudalkalibacillus hwajinpoensis]TKD69152.1 ABC transporter ATP-binding protein [Pseudalkalibacillus hwajinpoensis]